MDCQTDGCIRKVFAAGLCHRHYEEKRLASAPPCKIDGCDARSERAGMCNAHYRAQIRETKPPCTIDGCTRPQHTGGLCTTHHMRIRRYGSLENDKRAHDRGARERHPLYQAWHWRMRRHSMCSEWARDFWGFVATVGDRPSASHILRRRDQSKPMGPDNWLWLETVPNRKAADYMREHRKANPRYWRNIVLRKHFKIGIEEYDRMVAAQGGVCAICKQPETMRNNGSGIVQELSVDHCHSTKRIRGLLCSACNTSLGKVNDDVEILKEMISYLEKHK